MATRPYRYRRALGAKIGDLYAFVEHRAGRRPRAHPETLDLVLTIEDCVYRAVTRSIRAERQAS